MAPASVIGSTIAHYRVVDRLGEGGMGEVFLVEDLKLHRRAALKLISASLTRDETRRQRFLQEARLAASIDHPHIAAVHDIGEVDAQTFIVMEYVEGGSLRDALRGGPLKLRRALDLAIQAGDALAKVHEQGVIHRDLKPENLLITNDGYLKIIDFGLAKLVDPLAKSGLGDAATIDGHVRTADGVVLGTMGYMSPEQVRGEPVDARSDVFSFGAVLYEMISGAAPFRKGSAAETISAILGEAPPPPPRLDAAAIGAEVGRILRKCLTKVPAERYQGMRDLVVDLRAVRESMGSDSAAPGSQSAAVTQPASAQRRSAAWVAMVILAAVIGAGAWWALPGRTTSPASMDADMPVRPAVAVLVFEVMSGGPEIAWLGKGLPSLLVTGLAQTPDLEVVGNERLAEAAKQIGAGALDSVERSRLGELSRRAGARFVVNGTIFQAGADLRIDARVEDLTTGAVLLAESVRGTDAFALADDLAARVRRGLDVHAAPESVRRVADVSSASVDAFRAFTTGVEAHRNNRAGDARRLLEEAIALDPQFGLAYFHLAGVANFQGRIGESRQLLAKAAEHLDRMPERDGLIVRAAVARNAGRADESDRLLETLLARYPDSEVGWLSLSRPFSNPARMLATSSRAVAALPLSPILQNQHGYALLYNEKIEDALQAFETYVKLRPSEPNALDSLAEGLLVSGDIPGALERYDAAIKGGYGGSRAGRVWTLAVAGRYDDVTAYVDVEAAFKESPYWPYVLSRLGQYREAAQRLGAIAVRAAKNEATEMVVAADLTAAMFALERRDCPGVGRSGAAAERTLAALRPDQLARWQVVGGLLAGACEARIGQLAAARQHLTRVKARLESTSPVERWWVAALEGEIALAERDYDRATRSFAAGEPTRKMFFSRSGVGIPLSFLANNLVLRDGRARAMAAQGRLDDAITIYRGLLTPGPQQKWTAMLDPLHVIGLARVLDQDDQRDAARAEYQRFLELWKNADKELPELDEARAALSRLQ